MTTKPKQPNVAANGGEDEAPPMPSNKVSNELADRFGRLYHEIPKAVFAAIVYDDAMSDLLVKQVDNRHDYSRLRYSSANEVVCRHVMCKWQILYSNGVVPQRPPGPESPTYRGFEKDHERETS